MNKQLDEAITRLKSLPEDRQREAADLLFDFIDQASSDVHLTADQVAEIKRRLADTEPFATDEEVRATFDRLTK
jgi:recombinational DNA repair protein RecR